MVKLEVVLAPDQAERVLGVVERARKVQAGQGQ
jgi:hypothetical protein